MLKINVLKGFKLIDTRKNSTIDNQKIVKYILDFFDKIGKNKWNSFDLNYGDKVLNSLNALINSLESEEHRNSITYLCGMQSKTIENSFLYNNILDNIRELNVSEKPKYTYVSITLILYNTVEIDTIKEFFCQLSSFQFDYGYCFESDLSSDIYNERSKKKFWQLSNKDIGSEVFWTNHLSSVLQGFFRNIYRFNLLNEKHIQNDNINFIYDKYGELNKISDKHFLWILNDSEVKIVSEDLQNTPYLLGNDRSVKIFEKVPQKSLFRSEMKYPTTL